MMRRTRDAVLQAGRNIQERLTASEDSADMSLRAQAQLYDALLTARLELKFAASFQREVISAAGKELIARIESREQLLDQHVRLTELAGRLGVDVHMLGDSGDKDADIAMPMFPRAQLAAVATG